MAEGLPNEEGRRMKEEKLTLGDVSDSTIERSGPSGNEFVYVDISSVDRLSKTIVNPKILKTSKAPSRAKQHLKKGDVLVSMTRPNLNAVALVSPKFDGAICSTGFHIIRSKWIEPKFVFYLVQSRDFINDMSLRVQGALYPAVRPADISSFFLPPFSLSYQRSVVARIDELFSELDKGIESLNTAREQLKVYRQALLKHAFEGKLTEQWRRDNTDKLEPAEELLERIKQEREARYQQQLEEWQAAVKQWEAGGKEGKKPAKPKALGLFRELSQNELEQLDELPQNWAWTRLENLLEYVTSGSRGWAKYYSPSGATFIRAQNLKYDRLDLTDIAYVSLPESVEGKRTLTKKSDLLITITGANVTKSAYVKDELGEAYVSQHVALARLVNVVFARYLYLFLVSAVAGRRQLEKAAYGAGKPGLNLDNIKDLIVPISSAFECDVVSEVIEEKLSVVDEQIRGIDLSLSKSEALRQSILKKAFSGQLVPQDPNDEPASALLERIANEKEEAAAKAKKAKAAKKKTAKEKKAL
ncbi:MAG: hypothetical protein JMN24_07225 [gamma proteobacterium endosymbiont of Lamellibrachia anaximandri]|nr:hypothetical protein [gamma proteobacterium endosymbiont of Lamellibrachia anaximandri]MBL3618252.1 hypothetical protein [gamma proteobacterium endosymbiont of Lamellibrachia anaximandri]